MRSVPPAVVGKRRGRLPPTSTVLGIQVKAHVVQQELAEFGAASKGGYVEAVGAIARMQPSDVAIDRRSRCLKFWHVPSLGSLEQAALLLLARRHIDLAQAARCSQQMLETAH